MSAPLSRLEKLGICPGQVHLKQHSGGQNNAHLKFSTLYTQS